MKWLWNIAGWVFVGLAALGVMLPLVPTTPFLLLAAACFMRGSPRFYRWLTEHPTFGPTLQAYRAGKGITVRSKRHAALAIVASFSLSALFIPVLVGQVAFLALGAGIIAYIASRPTWDGVWDEARCDASGSSSTTQAGGAAARDPG